MSEELIQLQDSFYEDEIREGFYVPSQIKQAWGAEISVLNEVDRVCKKYGLKYFAAYGTLLGAVRHGGFIPWDDDFDITMTRSDFNKFMEVWRDELPQGFDVINYKTHPNHIYFISNVVANSHICFEKEHLEKYHGFPYIAGFDIFVLDNRDRDEETEKRRMKIADYIVNVADRVFDGRLAGQDAIDAICQIEKWCDVSVPKDLSGVELRIFLYSIAEDWFADVSDEEADRMTQVMPWGIKGTGYEFDREDFAVAVNIPFETGSIPVMKRYTHMLSVNFGDYMKLYKDNDAHEYPFFDGQKESLQKLLDFDMPGYRYDENLAGRAGVPVLSKGDTYKSLALEVAGEMRSLCTGINVSELIADRDSLVEILGGIQQIAIDLGNYIERIKGEGYVTIHKLENLCEKLYMYSQIDSNAKCTGENDGVCEDAYSSLHDEIISICDAVIGDISNRYEVVFMPFKAKYFDTMMGVLREALEEPNADVYVVPIPYYYKNYDGTLRDMQYDFDSYAFLKEINAKMDLSLSHSLRGEVESCGAGDEEYIVEDYNGADDTGKCTGTWYQIVEYTEYNLAIRRPERLYIQNPYDEFNETTSVPPEYYSKMLLKYTDELIYVPWFVTDDFDMTEARAYKNMRYYCTMPGVVNADRVILPSEKMRDLYIDKLCEFAGEHTRPIWTAKVNVRDKDFGADLQDTGRIGEAGRRNGFSCAPCDNEKSDANSDNRSQQRRTILYMPDFSSIICNRDKVAGKIEQIVAVFEEARKSADINLIWFEQDRIVDSLREADDKVFAMYSGIKEKYGSNAWIRIVSERETNPGELVGECDAYYGDPGALANLFRNSRKPVMIQNYDI